MNKNSKVLALKYRPQTFKDLIGQNVVVETILNSIKANKVPNAYLFTGIRGIGKTTTARIVAKSLNCLNGIDKLCKENSWGDPFSYARSREIHLANTLNHEVSKTLSGADAIDEDGECDDLKIEELSADNNSLIKVIDILGREHKVDDKGIVLFFIYENGKVIKKINAE